jgi:hypothetical protein
VQIVRQCADSAKALQRTDVYRAIIAEPSTQRLLARAVDAFEQSLLLLTIERDRSLVAFICEMKSRTIDLISALDDYQTNPSAVKEPEVLKKIDQIIASS